MDGEWRVTKGLTPDVNYDVEVADYDWRLKNYNTRLPSDLTFFSPDTILKF